MAKMTPKMAVDFIKSDLRRMLNIVDNITFDVTDTSNLSEIANNVSDLAAWLYWEYND